MLTAKMEEDPGHTLVISGQSMLGLSESAALLATGAEFVRAARTAPCYRMWSVGERGASAAMLRVRASDTAARALSVEVWAISAEGLVDFAARLPVGMCVGKVLLAGSGGEAGEPEEMLGVLGEAFYVEGETEITSFGGYRAYLEAKEQPLRMLTPHLAPPPAPGRQQHHHQLLLMQHQLQQQQQQPQQQHSPTSRDAPPPPTMNGGLAAGEGLDSAATALPPDAATAHDASGEGAGADSAAAPAGADAPDGADADADGNVDDTDADADADATSVTHMDADADATPAAAGPAAASADARAPASARAAADVDLAADDDGDDGDDGDDADDSEFRAVERPAGGSLLEPQPSSFETLAHQRLTAAAAALTVGRPLRLPEVRPRGDALAVVLWGLGFRFA